MEEIDLLHQRGKLEQTCGFCGRTEAAGFFCSWCGTDVGRTEWYRNDDVAERRRRMPRSAPANPPIEYRRASHWPEIWGPYPYKGPRPGESPQDAPMGQEVD